MKKDEILGHLRAAKSGHIKWVQKAKLLINGIDVQEDAIPVDSTECNFGKWFYADGQVLNALSNNPPECMQAIEQFHFQLHDKYMQIFNLYFSKEKKGGFFAKLLGLKRKELSDAETQMAHQYYDQLEKISHDLLDEINRLERRLIAVPEEKLSSLV